jgi:hypothetical protein
MSDWLKSVKAGDQVAIEYGSYGHASYTICTVVRVTPKHGHIVLDNGKKFDSRAFGYEVGASGYNRCHIVAYDDKVKANIEREEVKRRLGKWSDWLVKFVKDEQDVEKLKDALAIMRDLKPLAVKEGDQSNPT